MQAHENTVQVNKPIFEISIKVKEEKDGKIKDKNKLKLSFNHQQKICTFKEKMIMCLKYFLKNVEFD